MIPKYRAWHKTWKEMGRIAFIRYKKSGEIARLSFRRNIYDGSIYGGLVNLDEIELMQSTGLVDKNGKEVFVGDVIAIEVDDTETPINARVSQNSKIGVLMFHVFEDNEDVPMVELLEDNSVAFEILGNIYENPELLEVE